MKKSLSQRENYKSFLVARREFQKNIVRWMRIGICIPALLFFAIIIPFGGPHSKTMLIAPPFILVAHWVLTTLVIRERFLAFCPLFINIELSFFLSFSIESISLYTEWGMYFGTLLGVEVTLLFSLLLVSKLPFRNIFISYVLFTIHILIRASSYITWVTSIFFISIGLFLLFIYRQMEALDLRTFNELQRKQTSLLQFKQLIHNFPNQIIIINKEAYEKKIALYMNEQAKKVVQMYPDVIMFLENFSLEEMNFEGKKNTSFSGSLDRLIEELLKEKEKPSSFCHYLSTFNDNKKKSDLQKSNFNKTFTCDFKSDTREDDALLQNTSLLGQGFYENGKFEIVIGSIEWGNKEKEQDALIITLNDVSEREKIHELMLLHKNKDRLLATVSHELRTPLNGIIGMVDVVDEKVEDKKLKKYLAIAKKSAKMLLLMINDILDTSQIQKGTLNLNFESVNISQAIENVFSLMKAQIKKKGLRFKYINKCESNITVRADNNRLQQIIFNLISNAFKFTDSGEISVEVYPTECYHQPHKTLKQNELDLDIILEEDQSMGPRFEEITVMVKDTGRGIKPAIIPELFKLFGKFEVSGNETGVGLGLAISQKLALQMTEKGIQLKSVYGKGSEFWITLKQSEESIKNDTPELRGRWQVPESPRKKLFSKHKLKTTNGQHNCNMFRKILVVDDDQVNHLVIAKFLSNINNLILEKVFNGADAVDIVRRRAQEAKFYDLILMDCNMPIMDGFEATKQIRHLVQNGDIHEVMIVAVTANVSQGDRDICLNCGMDDVISKSIQKKDFLEQIKKYLKEN